MRTAPDESLHFSSRRSKWLDDNTLLNRKEGKETNWKKQYKLRYNWSVGACEVQEIHVADRPSVPSMLVRLAEGVVVTANKEDGLRAWDLKEKELIATCLLEEDGTPTCLAIDEPESGSGNLGIALGFLDGAWGVWRLDVAKKAFKRTYRHSASINGALSAVAYANPHILTITESQLLSLYSFTAAPPTETDKNLLPKTPLVSTEEPTGPVQEQLRSTSSLEQPQQPRLIASLKSHTSWPPLSLSIRTTTSTIIASIAYSLPTYLSGYTIGLQELHLSPFTGLISSSRLTSALPQGFSSVLSPSSSSPSSGASTPTQLPLSHTHQLPGIGSRPTTLSYSHPYILATHLDNTLTLYLCTSTASSLTITPGMKLWGHTSSVSSAEITPRGKAVSVSTRGNELRVWELEGGLSSTSTSTSSSSTSTSTSTSQFFSSLSKKRIKRLEDRSVQIRPEPRPFISSSLENQRLEEMRESEEQKYEKEIEGRKRWVGFDDEMVIVLKESGRGTQALMIYDFT
jgi:hypothetical protein